MQLLSKNLQTYSSSRPRESYFFPLGNFLPFLDSYKGINFLFLQILLFSVSEQKPGNPAKNLPCGKEVWNVLSVQMEDNKGGNSRRKMSISKFQLIYQKRIHVSKISSIFLLLLLSIYLGISLFQSRWPHFPIHYFPFSKCQLSLLSTCSLPNKNNILFK